MPLGAAAFECQISVKHIAVLGKAVDERQLIELIALLRPAEDLALYRARMAVWPGTGELKGWQVQIRD